MFLQPWAIKVNNLSYNSSKMSQMCFSVLLTWC